MTTRSGGRGPTLFSLCVIALMAANYFSTFGDLDYMWQIRTGELIVRSGSLRPPESFSYTIAGTDVPDFEWLYEVAVWAAWSAFGYGGLKLLKTVLVGATLFLLGRRLHREGVPGHVTAAAVGVAVVVLAPAWNLRPLYCTTLGLLLVSGWLRDHCAGRRPLDGRLPLAMLLWANCHPGVITGQGLVAGAVAWEWLNRRLRLNAPLDRASCWRLTLYGGLGLAATFVSPGPVERLLYPFRPELAHPVQRLFTEMKPLFYFATRPPYAAALAYVVAGLVLVTLIRRFRQYRLWEVALLAGLALLANVAFRSLQDWLLVMLALGVPHLVALARPGLLRRETRPGPWAALRAVDRFTRRLLRAPLFRPQWTWPCVAFAILAVVSVVPPWCRAMPLRESPLWPSAALDWMERTGVGGRVFGPPDYGSYVGWRLGPRATCYVDTRGFFFPPELLEDSCYLPLLGPGWRERLDRVCARGTEYFLLETTGPRGELWRRLGPHAGEPLYRDAVSVLLTTDQVRAAAARTSDPSE